MRLTAGDRAALQTYLGWRVAVAMLGGATGGMLRAGQDGFDWYDRWYHWDAVHFVGIAQNGYAGEPTGVPNEAFFPGLPLLMRIGSWLGPSEVAVGVAVSALAAAVAAVALSRLAEQAIPGTGAWAVLAWLLAPTAVFLAAPYTEALFLALALPAWLAAKRQQWWLAGLLAALATGVRISGLFLAAALVVAWLTGPRRRLRDLPWLGVPALTLLGVAAVQQAATGSWLAWWEAQSSQEWNRSLHPFWETVANTWDAAAGATVSDGFVWPFRLELVAVALGVVTTGWCLARRWWGEATFVGLTVLALSFSFWYFSVPRAALLWWPLWIGVGAVLRTQPWVRVVWIGASGALAAVFAVSYFGGAWAG